MVGKLWVDFFFLLVVIKNSPDIRFFSKKKGFLISICDLELIITTERRRSLKKNSFFGLFKIKSNQYQIQSIKYRIVARCAARRIIRRRAKRRAILQIITIKRSTSNRQHRYQQRRTWGWRCRVECRRADCLRAMRQAATEPQRATSEWAWASENIC